MKILLNRRQYQIIKESGGNTRKVGKLGNFDIPSYNKISDFVSWMGSNRTKFISALSDVSTDAERKFNAMESLFKLAESGNIRAGELINGVPVEQYITRQGGLRDEFVRLSSKVSKQLTSTDWIKNKWYVTGDYEPYLKDLKKRVNVLDNYKFDASEIKIVNGPNNIWGREVIEIQTPNGDNFLIYKSTGTGAPELKQKGDWQVIAGFVPNPTNIDDVKWFIKDTETTQLSKGNNKYLTELDSFLKENGSEGLGKQINSKIIKSGTRVGSNYFDNELIDWSKIDNAKNIQEYNKIISQALKTGDFSKISKGGFEEYGIEDFQNFLRTKVDLESQVMYGGKDGTWGFKVK